MSNVKERLAELRALDRSLEIFGAKKHRYGTAPVSPDDIRQFEHELEVQLPDAYREFLLQVGHGGGPYYGVWGLEEIKEEILSLYNEFFTEEGARLSPAIPFPHGTEDVRLCHRRQPFLNGMRVGLSGRWSICKISKVIPLNSK